MATLRLSHDHIGVIIITYFSTQVLRQYFMGDTHDIPEFVTFDTSIRYPIVFEKLDMLYYINYILHFNP